MTTGDLTDDQRVAMTRFVGLTEVIKRRQAQVEELAEERRQVARVLRDLKVPVAKMAEDSGLGPQAVYKLLQV